MVTYVDLTVGSGVSAGSSRCYGEDGDGGGAGLAEGVDGLGCSEVTYYWYYYTYEDGSTFVWCIGGKVSYGSLVALGSAYCRVSIGESESGYSYADAAASY